MAGFPLITDNHVRQPIVNALLARGWDVVRVVDLLGILALFPSTWVQHTSVGFVFTAP